MPLRIGLIYFISVVIASLLLPSAVSALCQEPNGTWVSVGCLTDRDCDNARNPDNSPKCSIGSVCDTVTFDPPACVPPLGYSGTQENKIAGGYLLTGVGLGLLINNVILAIGAVSGLIFLAMLILGGIAYMTSQGDEKMLNRAKQQITAGLIGLLIIFMSWWAVKIIGFVFGIDLLVPKFTGP